MDGFDVGGAGNALIGHGGVRRLEDLDLADEFGRILVVFDGTVVVGRSLFAAVERGDGVVRAEAADRQGLGAAIGPLRGDAGQAGDRFSDRIVRQLADIFGRHGFDDR